MEAPGYFERVRASAARRWEQLEADPELAAPWRQLFLQVQSPRHVVSELLQNADDAGATRAEIRISDGTFVLEHNGRDFREEEFLSLCRFGYSNKRSLHTIGHRGIGFKSTFSLGDTVELVTPTLSVAFRKSRFTLPDWAGRHQPRLERTAIRVTLADERRKRELQTNIDEWANNAVSLLFFRNIRELEINARKIRWEAVSAGAPDNSQWFRRPDEPGSQILLIRAQEEAFPEDALAEIRAERILGEDESLEFPPSSVEIALGAKGELFAVLPTRVATLCPFASNAPFIQDPAREGIKDPNISPTNRWLLERIGQLAAAAMLQWIGDPDLPDEYRSAAYDILPPEIDGNIRPLDQSVAEVIRASFWESVDDEPFVLGFGRELYASGVVTSLPDELLDAWPEQDMAPLFDGPGRVSLEASISDANAEKLVRLGVVKTLERSQILQKLRFQEIGKPGEWAGVFSLWSYVTQGGVRRYGGPPYTELHIIPVQGEELLYPSASVVRLSETKLLRSDDDWSFLAPFLRFIDQGWLGYLARRRRISDDGQQVDSEASTERAFDLLRAINLAEGADATRVIEQVCEVMFHQAPVRAEDAIRLAWIAAELNANIGKVMKYVTVDGSLEGTREELIFDRDGTISGLLPAEWCEKHVLSESYLVQEGARSGQAFAEWALGDRSGLGSFALPKEVATDIYGRTEVGVEMRRRGAQAPAEFPYRSSWFSLRDWDYEEGLWGYWAAAFVDDPDIYASIIDRLFDTDLKKLRERSQAWVWQNSVGGNYQKRIYDLPMLPTWILKAREFPCLRDTNGLPRKPSELMRRTEATEPFLGIEPFVQRSLDVEAAASLLDMLGVQTEPQNPDKILDRVRALSFASVPPAAELETLYRRLDLICAAASTDDLERIRQFFESEALIFTQSGEWKTSIDVVVQADEEDAPGAAVVRASVQDLSMWPRIGVAQRPTLGRSIDWLNKLPSRTALDTGTKKRVRALLSRYPDEVWTACERWLTLSEELTPVAELRWQISMQSLVPQTHLFNTVRSKVADFRMLSGEHLGALPFSGFPTLGSCIREEISSEASVREEVKGQEWLREVGTLLAYAQFDDPNVTQRVSALATSLAETALVTVDGLEAVPFIGGVPAGSKRRVNALWSERSLFVTARSPARLAEDIVAELGRFFGLPEVTAALRMCFERSRDFIEEYIEENFILGDDLPAATAPGADGDEFNARSGEGDDAPAKLTLLPAGDVPPRYRDDIPAVAVAEPRRPRRRVDLFERFAISQGFQKLSSHRYEAADGRRLERVVENIFPWRLRSPDGAISKEYWALDKSLDAGPIDMPSEVWEMAQRRPESTVFVLADLAGAPVLLEGQHLRELHRAGRLTLHPASYRLQKKAE